jgi:hypothetical protein
MSDVETDCVGEIVWGGVWGWWFCDCVTVDGGIWRCQVYMDRWVGWGRKEKFFLIYNPLFFYIYGVLKLYSPFANETRMFDLIIEHDIYTFIIYGYHTVILTSIGTYNHDYYIHKPIYRLKLPDILYDLASMYGSPHDVCSSCNN